jgi:GMP synthase (glutamine-hydrolysing)
VECPTRRLYGLQYHPEVVHSKNGVRTLKQFLFEVARIPADWKMSNVLEEEMAKISGVVRVETHTGTAMLRVDSQAAMRGLGSENPTVQVLCILADHRPRRRNVCGPHAEGTRAQQW